MPDDDFYGLLALYGLGEVADCPEALAELGETVERLQADWVKD